MKVTPKIPYTEKEITYMIEKLRNVIKTINEQNKTVCSCNK